jgi:BASS family bile acid:Na+ symporter
MVSRHPGLAMAVVRLTDQPLAPAGVLFAVVVSDMAVVPYNLWRQRLRAAGPAAAGCAPGAR